jgi:simple sugar transport system permease protein
MNIWNIGAEGQLYLGAIGATWVALTFPGLPAWAMIPAMMAGGMLGGLLWALGPALLKAKIQVNEIITTLMLNYVAVHLVEFMVFGPWKDPTSFGFPMTPVFSDAATLPALGTTRVHLGLVMGLALVVVVFFLFKKSRLGFTMRAIGANRSASRLSGMPVSKTIVISLCLSGAVAGLAGMTEVAGIQHRLQPGISPGYGYTAIIVAWLARLNPWAMVVVSFLFGALLVGGELLQITMKVSAHLAMLIQGLVLFFVLAGDFVGRFRVRWIKEEK